MEKIKALEIAHTLSTTSKMPCASYSLSAETCKTGAKLKKIKGSVCEGCYASKGCYNFKSTRDAMERRFAAIHHEMWEAAMIELISRTRSPYFRWHDSGDLQGVWHLQKIINIANAMPHKQFWLPTREKQFVRPLQDQIPVNLIIRISATMVDGERPAGWEHTSGVSTNLDEVNCEAYKSEKAACGTCRKCWDPKVAHVVYKRH